MILNEKLTDTVKVGIWSFKKPFRGLEILQIDSVENLTESHTKALFEEIADPTLPFVEKYSGYKL